MRVISVLCICLGIWANSKQSNTINWEINSVPQWQINNTSYSAQWKIPISKITKIHSTKRPPQEVINYAKQLAAQYRIEAVAILAACYHERGIINWYDDFLCGFGAINNRPSTWNHARFGGWEKQLTRFAKRANNCGYFRIGSQINTLHAQNFARYCYKTEAWQNYSRIIGYIGYFRQFL